MLPEIVTTVPVPLTMKGNITGYLKDKYITYFLRENKRCSREESMTNY